MNEPKVAYRNKLWPFWLSTCLDIGCCTAFYFQVLCPPQKNRGWGTQKQYTHPEFFGGVGQTTLLLLAGAKNPGYATGTQNIDSACSTVEIGKQA